MDKEKLQELRKKKNELIWAGGPAREIMKLARIIFWEVSKDDLPAAYVMLASDHYSLIKRYTHGLMWPLAAWRMWRAAWNTNVAFGIMGGDPSRFSADQIDIMTSVWTRVPWVLGGSLNRALKCLAFETPMKPHTRALRLITRGEIWWRMREVDWAWGSYKEAEELIHAIETEDSPDREKQLCRVMSSIGFFYYDHAGGDLRQEGESLIYQAAHLATQHSGAEFEKIRTEWAKRQKRKRSM